MHAANSTRPTFAKMSADDADIAFDASYNAPINDVINATSSNLTNHVTNTFWLYNGCQAFEFFLSTVVIGFLCLVGIAGNIMSVFVLNMDKQHRVAAYLLQVLAVSDSSVLVLSAVVLSGIVGPAQIPSVLRHLKRIIPYLKVYVNPLGYVMHSIAIWIVVLLAVNRYIAVCKPFHAQKWLTMWKTTFQVAIVIVLSVAVNIPRLFQYEVIHVTNALNESVPHPRLTEFGSNAAVEIGYFNAFYTSVVLVIPLVFLLGLNIKLIYTLQVTRRNMQRNSLYYIGSQEKNITRVMIIVIIQVLVCHTPDRVLTAVRQIDMMDGKRDITAMTCPQGIFIAQCFANVLIIINCSTNFLIYSIVRAKFRRNFLRLFCRCLPKCLTSTSLLQRRISELSNASYAGSERSMKLAVENGGGKKAAMGNGFRQYSAERGGRMRSVSAPLYRTSGPMSSVSDPESQMLEPLSPRSEPGSMILVPGSPVMEPVSPVMEPVSPVMEPGSPEMQPVSPAKKQARFAVTYRPDVR